MLGTLLERERESALSIDLLMMSEVSVNPHSIYYTLALYSMQAMPSKLFTDELQSPKNALSSLKMGLACKRRHYHALCGSLCIATDEGLRG